MAYIGAQEVKVIRQNLKQTFPDCKFSVRKSSGGHSVDIALMKGPEFEVVTTRIHGEEREVNLNEGHTPINHHHTKRFYGEKNAEFLDKVTSIAKGDTWYDRSDIMTDYFDTAYYISISVGMWDKDYEVA